MGAEKLGFAGATAIGLGGMIGGGVFSVLGVVATIAGAASWAAFTAASLVSMCAAYSYLKLNDVGDVRGGSVSLIEEFVGNSTLAGMVGWTLLFGYIGAIAMYAFAFGSFTEQLVGTGTLAGVPFRPLASVLGVAVFVGLNVLGARATGTSEEVLVALKLVILFGISAWGLWYGAGQGQLSFGFDRIASTSFATAVAVSFVSFQGWQLLMYDQGNIENATSTLPKAVFVSIVGAIVIDSMVAVLVTSLVETSVISQRPEVAVAVAVEPFLGQIGFTFVAVAAIFSTGSAINGTLFSAANFAKGMLADDLLPDQFGDSDADGAPPTTVLVLGAAAAAFTAYGSLEAITSFGSLAFLAVFGAMSYLAVRERDSEEIFSPIPAFGVLGTVAFFPLVLLHLWTSQRSVFYAVVLITVAVVAVELLYFERDHIADGVRTVENRL